MADHGWMELSQKRHILEKNYRSESYRQIAKSGTKRSTLVVDGKGVPFGITVDAGPIDMI